MSEWTRTAEDHPVSLWELLEEERMIAHKLACSCDRHIFFVNFCAGCLASLGFGLAFGRLANYLVVDVAGNSAVGADALGEHHEDDALHQ